jgi:hypothetical protein
MVLGMNKHFTINVAAETKAEVVAAVQRESRLPESKQRFKTISQFTAQAVAYYAKFLGRKGAK